MTDVPIRPPDEEITFTLADMSWMPGNLTAREVYLHLKHKDDDPAISAAAGVTISAIALSDVSARLPSTATVNTLVELLAKSEERIASLLEYIEEMECK